MMRYGCTTIVDRLMRTTLTLDDSLLHEAMRRLGESSKAKTVNSVLAEWLRLRRLRELKALQGTLEFAYPIEDIRALEVAENREADDGAR
jgi:Arc/MetJ family transcription regulator